VEIYVPLLPFCTVYRNLVQMEGMDNHTTELHQLFRQNNHRCRFATIWSATLAIRTVLASFVPSSLQHVNINLAPDTVIAHNGDAMNGYMANQ
jgi:hypothetical protein